MSEVCLLIDLNFFLSFNYAHKILYHIIDILSLSLYRYLKVSVKFNQLSNAIRFLSVDAVQKANSGHPGMPMGMADVATTLFKYHLRFNPKNPEWINRDRFVLSAGHGSMLLYSLLYLTGYKSVRSKILKISDNLIVFVLVTQNIKKEQVLKLLPVL